MKGQTQFTKKYLIAAFAALGVVGLILFVRADAPQREASVGGGALGQQPAVVVESAMIDLGAVPMSQGIAERTFMVRNTGAAPLRIANLITSCMCTSAQLEVEGKKSPKFGMPGHGGNSSRGWSMEIPSNGEGSLRVFYDPNAHGPSGTGPFRRDITFTTNDPDHQEITVSIKGTVVR